MSGACGAPASIGGRGGASEAVFTALTYGYTAPPQESSNLKFKELQAYEPLQIEGDRYKIAVHDGQNFELVDINFPFCSPARASLPAYLLRVGHQHRMSAGRKWSAVA